MWACFPLTKTPWATKRLTSEMKRTRHISLLFANFWLVSSESYLIYLRSIKRSIFFRNFSFPTCLHGYLTGGWKVQTRADGCRTSEVVTHILSAQKLNTFHFNVIRSQQSYNLELRLKKSRTKKKTNKKIFIIHSEVTEQRSETTPDLTESNKTKPSSSSCIECNEQQVDQELLHNA